MIRFLEPGGAHGKEKEPQARAIMDKTLIKSGKSYKEIMNFLTIDRK
jgi:hypothetical protein